MKIHGKPYRSIWLADDGWSIKIFDQRALPWDMKIVNITSAPMAATAIKEMWTRGAPLIGVTAAYGLAMALRIDARDESLLAATTLLRTTRPTAINLQRALDRVHQSVQSIRGPERVHAAYAVAANLCEEDVAMNRAIGQHGLTLIRQLASRHPDRPVNILTHCNSGWLATVDYGTALAPIYLAHDAGISVHVWVDETRPRNQGALLTAFELTEHGVPHTVIADNAGGLLMQRGAVDLCLVGTDRVTQNGDVCNKIGTYLKALAAHANQVPFYIALPSATYDPALAHGGLIPIEERSTDEVCFITGISQEGVSTTVRLTASPTANPAFDITPAHLVSGYVTEKGIFTDFNDFVRQFK